MGQGGGVEKGLEEVLREKDIEVVEKGQYDGGKVNYIFDFKDDAEVMAVGGRFGAKTVKIMVEEAGERMDGRVTGEKGTLIWLRQVYGPGMKEEGWLAEAIVRAVRNENLVLPDRKKRPRLLAIDDAVEAILRGMFLGEEGGVVEIWGEEAEIDELAKVLINKAKMTRFKVAEKEVEILEPRVEVENEWRKLRWRPEVNLALGMDMVLQYFFTKEDEKRRVKKRELKKRKSQAGLKKENWKGYRVEVEERGGVDREIAKIEENEAEVGEMVVGKEIKGREEEIKRALTKVREWEKDDGEEEVAGGVEYRKGTEERNEEAVEKKEPGKKYFLNWPEGWEKWLAGTLGLALLMLAVAAGTRVLRILNYPLKGQEMIKEGKYDQLVKESEGWLLEVRKAEEGFGGRMFGDYLEGLRLVEVALEVEREGARAAKEGEKITEAVLRESEIDFRKTIDNLAVILGNLDGKVAILEARLKGKRMWLPAGWRKKIESRSREMAKMREGLAAGREFLGVLPGILGIEGNKKKEYLVLFQNENELRPGGGFIGSYGILSFDAGKLAGLEVKDVYEADGQLKGHVEPPEEIRAYLGEGGWFMRDANWQASFPAAAKDVAWFLEKETGRGVDGVIGINLTVAKAMVGVAGEVYVADFKEKINKNNLYEQAEFYSETKFFPGSVQKASFLGALAKTLLEEIKLAKGEKLFGLAEATLTMLSRNEIQVWVEDKKAAAALAGLGWDGAMFGGKCSEDSCVADYLYLVEANLGVNKANYFVYRNVEQLVEVGENGVSRVVKINYENSAKTSSWPGGDYKNYLRVYLPLGANLAEVSISEGEGGNKKIYNEGEYRVKNYLGRKEVGLLAVVPVAGKRQVEIRYSLPVVNRGGLKMSYLLYVQKQSGFGDTGLVTLFSWPKGWQVNQVQPEGSIVNEKLLFNQKLSEDMRMGIELVKEQE